MSDIVTIEDIAKKAGVGKGTVDRVLHNRGRVSDETREKVLNCIKELNYKPNKAARMLAKRKSFKIAVTYHDKEKEFWNQIKAGIDKVKEEYSALGVNIDEFVIPHIDIDEQEKIINHIIKENYDGLAIVPYDSPRITDAVNRAIEKGIQVVTFNNHQKEIKACYVGQNGIQGGRTAGKLLAMIAPSETKYAIFSAHNKGMAQIDERSAGFQEHIKRHRPDICLTSVFNLPEDHQVVFDTVQSIFKERVHEIDAIYVTTAIAGTVAAAIEKLNIEKKILFIGHDITETNKKFMKKGIIDIIIGQEPELQSYTAVDKICKKLLTDEELGSDIHTKISVFVTENLDG